jgi:hypothetical protein
MTKTSTLPCELRELPLASMLYVTLLANYGISRGTRLTSRLRRWVGRQA